MAACIGIHAFAIRHEAEERRRTDPDFDELAEYEDPFINDGLTTTSDSDSPLNPSHSRARAPTRLQLAKTRREKLKEKLFRSKIKKAQQVALERRGALGVDISGSESESL